MKKEKALKHLNPLFLKGIAHRGLHTKEFTENGMKAFQNAIDHHIAFELDVHLTKDNQLIVCHDDDLKRTTGKEGIIEELTVQEIKSNYHLLDGGEIPTLQEVIALNDEKVPMVIELKVRNRNYKPLAKRLCEELKNVKDYRNYHLISFDPRALFFTRKTKFINALLVTTSHIWTYHFRFFFDSLDLEYCMTKEKRVQRYAKKHLLNVWTIDSKESFDEVYPYVDTITFQLMDEKYVTDKLTDKNFK